MELALFRPDQGRPSDPPGARVGAVITAYLNHLRARAAAGDYSPDGLANVQRDLQRFAAWPGPRGPQGDQVVEACPRNDLVDWLLANPQWKSGWTKRRAIAAIVACFSWAAIEAGLIARCPYQKPRSLRLPVKPRREASPAEYVALMRGGSRELRRALYALRRTGMRTCEMREVEFDDIAWGQSAILLDRHKTERYSGRPRRILLDPGVLRFLRNLQRQRRANQKKIFVNTRGRPWNRRSFALHFRRCAKRLGLDEGVVSRVSAYCLRHFFTGKMGEAGYSDRQVATMLGHSSTRLVSNYNHNRDNDELLRRMAGELRSRSKGRPVLPADGRPFLPGLSPAAPAPKAEDQAEDQGGPFLPGMGP